MGTDGGPVSQRLQRATRAAALAFAAAVVAGIGLIVVYAVGLGTPAQGALLFVAFGGITVGLTVWVKALIDEPDVVEDRPPMRSSDEDRRAFLTAYEGALAAPDPDRAGRRRFLSRLLAAAGVSVGAALLVPFRSLGPRPEAELFETEWEEGIRLVTSDGRLIRPQDLAVGSVETVFPEGLIGDYDSQAILIRVEPELLELPEGSPPTVEGFVCYSKVCTHAGCPVGLYRSAVGELLCPCHQSKFNVYEGAQPISGPTVRPLPQLPLGLDGNGFFVAIGDFQVPVGPGFWNMELGG